MEISIANADVGEEVEATSMVAAVGEKMRYNLLKNPLNCVHRQHFIGLTGILFMMIIIKISHCDD